MNPNRTILPRALSIFLAPILAGCAVPPSDRAVPESGPSPELRERLLSVAANYVSYGRVDDMNRWTPTLCTIQPGVGRISDAPTRTGHGGKLFYLYAKDRDAYVDPKRDHSSVGQTIVKEAWTPVEVGVGSHVDANVGRPPAKDGDKLYRPGERTGLFIMMKLGRNSPEPTDEGWVYATLDADGRTIHQAGVLESCVRCHCTGTTDRLFGLADVER